MDVKNSPGFDFREFKGIGENMKLKNEKIKGYNSYFVAREDENALLTKAVGILFGMPVFEEGFPNRGVYLHYENDHKQHRKRDEDLCRDV